MRIIIIYYFLFFNLIGVFSDEIIKFEPLKYNERFAYSLDDRNNIMTLYIVNNNNSIISEDNSWSNVGLAVTPVQLTNNYRMCFFVKSYFIDIYGIHHDLYIANGITGEIKKVMEIQSPFRITENGKYIGFIDPNINYEIANIYIYDTEENSIIKIFEWRTKKYIDGVWHITRNHNSFIIYGLTEGGYACAEAILDTDKMELLTMWDFTDSNDANLIIPHISELELQDDIIQQMRNPNVRLR